MRARLANGRSRAAAGTAARAGRLPGLTATLAALALPLEPSAADAWFSVGGEHRARHETLEGQFRSGFAGDTRALSLRTLLQLEGGPGGGRGELRGGLELIDARADIDADLPVDTTIVNTLEPLELYVGWRRQDLLVADAVGDLRAGLVTIDLGKRRLLARNRFRNTINSFAGIDWHWQLPGGAALRAFVLHPVTRLPSTRDALADNEQRRDEIRHERTLSGVLYAPRPLAGEVRSEVYVLRLDEARDIDAARSRDLTTGGFRLYRLPAAGQPDFELEAMLQRGNSGPRQTLEHDASFVHAEAGYTFAARWMPRIVAQLDYASGDDDPLDERNEAFDTLYGSRRFDFGPTGIYGPVGRSNLSAAALRVGFAPTSRLDALIAWRTFRLASATDAWSVAGLSDPAGASGDSIGRQLDARLTWQAVPGRLAVEIGGARLTPGDFARRVSGATGQGDTAYGYAQLTVRF